MRHVVPPEWEREVTRLNERVRLATGEDLGASIRWVSEDEQRVLSAEIELRMSAPGVRVVRLGSSDSGASATVDESYHGYWALVLPGQETMTSDVSQIADEVEDHVIEPVWLRTGQAPMPGFLAD